MRSSAIALTGAALAGAFTGALAACRPAAPPAGPFPVAAGWQRVGDGITCGVSGLAPVGRDVLLLAHDNKLAGEPRLATLAASGGRVTYRPVAWRYDAAFRAQHAALLGALLGAAPDSVPVDLEALATVPGQPGAFFAVTSRGVAYRVQLSARGDSAAVDAVLAPHASDSLAAGANYEGFVALAAGGGAVIGVWADRGADARPGVLRWGVLDASRGVVPTAVLDTVRAYWPTTPEARHVSDLALVGDTLFAGAASDAGDAGPFASALWRVGTLTVDGGVPRLRRDPDSAPRLRFDGRKVEAIAVLPEGPPGRAAHLVVGTDDELHGGVVRRSALPAGAALSTSSAADTAGVRAAGACVPAAP